MELRRSTLKNPIPPPKPEIKEMQICEEEDEDDSEEEETHPLIEKEPITLEFSLRVLSDEVIPEPKVVVEEEKVQVSEI